MSAAPLLLLTLSTTDPTETDEHSVGALVAAHLNSCAELYPADRDPVWVEPRTCQNPNLPALDLLLRAAEVGLDGGCEAADVPADVVNEAYALLAALRADVGAVRDSAWLEPCEP